MQRSFAKIVSLSGTPSAAVSENSATTVLRPQPANWLGRWLGWQRRPLTFGVATLIAVAAFGVVGFTALRSSALAINLGSALSPPSWSHLMGTDEEGRDVFARFCYGAGVTLFVAVVTTLLSAVVAGFLGLAAGLLRGPVDVLVLRLLDMLLAFPPLILAMVVAIALGPGITSAIIGITLGTVPFAARLMRSEVIRIRALPLVEGAEALGVSKARTVVRHIIPHTLPSMLAQFGASFAGSVITLAGLSFLGLGVQIPTPDWGNMITEGVNYALNGQWWIAVFPGVGILWLTGASYAISRTLQASLSGGAP
jgi:peptide/nickel transport system permease protein